MHVYKLLLTSIFILFGIQQSLYALTVDTTVKHQSILSYATIYKDYDRNSTIEKIRTKQFQPITSDSLGFGYSPSFHIWLKVSFTNPTQTPIQKVLEYANPLTSYVNIYHETSNKPLLHDGLLAAPTKRKTLNPTYTFTIPPQTTQTFYIQAYSNVTTLITKLHLWNKPHFMNQEQRHQLVLALFLGAMFMVIIYNFFIFLTTKELAYLYYVLLFTTITFHHILYKGVGNIYLFTIEQMQFIISYSSLIVALPTLFLAIFTKTILSLEQYPKLNKTLIAFLYTFPFFIITINVLELHTYRNLFSIILTLWLFGITLYAIYKRNRQAYFILVSWILFISTALSMYLSSLGVLNIFHTFPYYAEFSFVMEAIIFSFVLTDKIKQLYREKMATTTKLIKYQESEKERLEELVNNKTEQLQISLREKELLLKELNHRVKNSIQTIVSFLRLQIDNTEHTKTQNILKNLENRILAINHLYALLHTKHNLAYVNAYEYFSLLIDSIQTTFQKEHVTIELNARVNLKSEDAIYCGFLLNEALSNTLQHAFDEHETGRVKVNLTREEQHYTLAITDNGKGFDSTKQYNSLGLMIMQALAVGQLKGSFHIESFDGVHIVIEWSEQE
jgi:two-component sensor histidine kinase